MRVSSKRWVLQAIVLLLIGQVAFLLGVGVLWLGNENIRLQDHLLKVRYSLTGSEEVGNIKNDQVRWLLRNEFFSKPLTERPWLARVRTKLPDLLGNRYFRNVWQLLLYVEYFGDSEAIYKAIRASIEEDALLESSECIDFRACNATGEANVTAENAAILFMLLDRAFVQPALQAYSKHAYADAAALAKTALSVARMVDLDPRQSAHVYDQTLVLGAFLTRPDAVSGQIPYVDIERLRLTVRKEHGLAPLDPEMAAYHTGVTLLRNGCFKEASDLFAAAAAAGSHGPVTELFAFMSLRAAATPFFKPEALKSKLGDNGREIVVVDCDNESPVQALAGVYRVREERFSGIVLHAGLASDVEFFGTKVPSDENAFKQLAFKVLAAESEKREEPEPTSPVTAEVTQPVTRPEADAPRPTAVEAIPDGRPFAWPVSGKVIADFASSKGTGINIEAPEGAAVRSAENGQVIYAGSGVEGYGNLMLVRHPNGYVSAYGHLKDFTFSKGDIVRRGEKLGSVGMTGSVSRPQLHFELRKGATPVDPIPFLAAADSSLGSLERASPPTPADVLNSLLSSAQEIVPPQAPAEELSDPTSVAKAQRGLASLGFLHGPADGVLGEPTRKAIRNFQVYFNYKVTGSVAPELLEQLVNNGASI